MSLEVERAWAQTQRLKVNKPCGHDLTAQSWLEFEVSSFLKLKIQAQSRRESNFHELRLIRT